MAEPLVRKGRKDRAQTARERVKSGAYLQKSEPTTASPLTREPLVRKGRDTQAAAPKPVGLPSESAGARAMHERQLEQSEVPSVQPDYLKPKRTAYEEIQNFQNRTPLIPKSQNELLGERLREVPVLGSIYRGLDKLQRVTEPAANIAQEYYTPGAGLSVLSAAEKGAVNLAGKLLPKAAPLVRRSIAEAGIGAVAGGGQSLSAHPERGFEGASEGALYGAGGGALIPFVGAGLKQAVQPLKRFATGVAEDIAGNALGKANEMPVTPPTIRRAPNVVAPEPTPATIKPTRGIGRGVKVPTTTPEQPVPTPKQEVSGESTPRQQGVRSNFKQQAESEGISQNVKNEIDQLDHTYNPINNADTIKQADTNIANKGVDKALADFLGRSSTEAEHIAEGYRLMQLLDARGNYNGAATVAAKVAKDLTKAGQQAQAGSIIKRLSPEGRLIALQRRAEGSKLAVSDADAEDILKSAKEEVEALKEPARQNVIIDTLEDVKAGGVQSDETIETVRTLSERARKQLPESAPKAERKPITSTRKQKVLDKLGEAAKAAEARIAARRNQGFLPKGGSDFIDYGIILADDLAKKAVNQANYVEYVVKKWGEPMREHAGKILNIAKREILRHPELREKDVKAVEDIVDQWIKKTPAKTSDVKKIKDLADSLKALQGKKGKEANVAIQQIMNKYDKGSVLDKVQAVRYMAMLGNTLTQGINATSGLAKAQLDNVIDLFGWMVDGLVSKITSRERSTAAIGMNPFEYIGGLWKNLGEGVTSNWKGVTPGGLTDPSEINGLAFKGSNPISKVFQLGERSLRAVAGGADYMTYKTQFDNEIMKQAKLAASKDTTGASKKSITEKFVNAPPPEAIELADKIGRRATFQQKDSLGSVAAGLVSKAGNIPGAGRIPGKIVEQTVRATLPFIRTPLNIAQTAIQMTPVGAIQGLYGIVRAGTAAEQRLAVQNLGLGVTGTGLGALGWFLSDAGVITDSNDSGDKDLNAVREQAGKGKYRFNQDGAWRLLKSLLSGKGWDEAKSAAKYKEGDTTFDYNRLQPLTFPIAVGAGAQKGGAVGGVGEGANSLLNLSSLSGLQNLFATAPGGSATEKNASLGKKFIEGYIKSFSPSLLAQEARRQDTTQRNTPYNKGIIEDVVGYQKSRTPGLSKSLPAKITTLGEEKKIASGIWRNYVNPYRSEEQAYSKAAGRISDLIDRTGNEGLAPSAPEKTVDIGEKSVPIPPKRYEQYQRDIGKEIATKVNAIPSSLTDKQMTVRIQHIQEDVKAKYRRRIKAELRRQQ